MARYTLTLVCDPARCGGAPTVGDRRIPLAVLIAALRPLDAMPARKRNAELAGLREGFPTITDNEWHVLRALAWDTL